ncbi:MAG: BatA domain-containing protein [Ignavibacteriota bacterium]
MIIDTTILIALAAVAIPILLHLLNLQKVQKMEFSTLMFLKEIQKSRFRRIRIKHLLLLIVRIFIIIFLVLAFADPLITGYSSKGSNTRKLGIVYLDSSYSMLSKNDSVTLYDKSKKIANQLSQYFTSSDEVITLTTTVQSDTTPDRSFIKSNFNSILHKTNEILQSKNYNTSEVFIISDLQKVNYHNNQYLPNDNTHFYFIDAANDQYQNLSVSNIILDTKLPEPSKPVKINVVVRNHNESLMANQKLNIYLNDVKVDEKFFDISPREIKKIEVSFKPQGKGLQTIKAELVPDNKAFDAFTEDNVFFRRFYIPEKINIGLVSKEQGSTRFIKAVFDAENKSNPESKVYNYTETGTTDNINSFDVIYLCGLKNFSVSDVENIQKYIISGKGVFIFPSDNISTESYNKLSTFKLTKQESINKELPIKEINAESPLFEGLFKINKDEVFNASTLDKISLKSYYPIVPAGKSSPLIAISSGILLSEDANLLISSVSADETMSDFPRHSLFAPVILRSASYLSSENSLITSQTTQTVKHETILTERDTLESNPELILPAVLKTSLSLTGIKNYTIVDSKDIPNLETIIAENRSGKSLWNYALIASLLFLAFEIFLLFSYKEKK